MRNLCFSVALMVAAPPVDSQGEVVRLSESPAVVDCVWNPSYEGIVVGVGDVATAFAGPHTIVGVERTDALAAEWRFDDGSPDGRRIRVEYTRPAGVSVEHAVETFRESVLVMAALYPPTTGIPGPQGILVTNSNLGRNRLPAPGPQAIGNSEGESGDGADASWMHDLDGDGPLYPIEIELHVTRRPSEGVSSMMRGLCRRIENAARKFPPNVPRTV